MIREADKNDLMVNLLGQAVSAFIRLCRHIIILRAKRLIL